MNKKLFGSLVAVAVLGTLSGCAVVPTGRVVYSQPTTVQPSVVEQQGAVEDDGMPPAEYLADGLEPVFYDVEPGVAFWPVFFGYPGSCFCYMPARYFGGAWYGPGHDVIHRGHLPFYRGGTGHLNAWREGHGAFRGHSAVPGRMERGPAGRMHAVPPSGIHSQPRGQAPRVGQPPQHVQPQPRPVQPQVRPQAPQQQRPQPQMRPQPQQRAPAPVQRAPQKKN